MKKIILIGCLTLISACQTATPTPEPSLFPPTTLPASPTPIPDTPTPEPTFTPELTSTPLPRLFTNQFDTNLAGWVILQAGNEAVPVVSTENSVLRLQMDSPYTWLYAIYGAFDYANVYVEAQYINSALTPASAGLICRYSETDGWLEYNVSTDGSYNVLYGQWLDTGIADYLPIIDGLYDNVKQSGELQQIGMNCADTTVRLYINSIIIRSVDVSSYDPDTGKVGITTSSYENTPVVVLFDTVTVGEFPPP
jgi:hypothetical protein